jgi:hypothetical protein
MSFWRDRNRSIASTNVHASANAAVVAVGCSITPTPFWRCNIPTTVVDPGLGVPVGRLARLRIRYQPRRILLSMNTQNNAFGLGANELLVLSSLDAGAPIIGISNLVVSGSP